MQSFWSELKGIKRLLTAISIMLPTAVCGAVASLTYSPYIHGAILGMSPFLVLTAYDGFFLRYYREYRYLTKGGVVNLEELEAFRQKLFTAISVYRLILFFIFLGLLLPFLKGAVIVGGLMVSYGSAQLGVFDRVVFVVLILSIAVGLIIRRRYKEVRKQIYGLIPKPEKGKWLRLVKSLLGKDKGQVLLVALVFTLVPLNSFAFDPSHVEFYTYGGFNAVDSAFHFIALIFSDTSYQGLFYTIMAVSLFLAGAASYFRFLQGRQEGNILTWAGPVLIAFVLFLAFVKPKGEVTVYDKVLNRQDTISNIPIGITTIAGLTSVVGDGLLQIIDTTSIDPNLSYENSAGGIGVLTIYNSVTHSLGIDSDFDRSMRRYIEDCYFFCLEKGGCDLKNLTDSSTLLSDELSKGASPSVYTVYYDSANPNGVAISCQDAWNNYLSGTLNNTTSYQNDAKRICAEVGIDANDIAAFQHCVNVTESYLQRLYNGLYPSVTDSVYTYLEQDYIAQQVYLAAMSSNTTLLTNYQAITNGLNIGMAFNTWIPTIRGVLIAFGLSLLPFLILFLPTPFFGKILGVSVGVFLFQISWLVIDAVIHYFLVHQAASLFESVYIAHNIGYASFLVMQSPLAKALAMWGYLRSMGMGLSFMAVAAVTKVGAYGLQRIAGGITAGIEAGAIKGEESINPTEQGKLEDEISNSIASRSVNAGMTWIRMRRDLMDIKAGKLGAGDSYAGETEAYNVNKELENKLIGKTQAEASVAGKYHKSMRDYGYNIGMEQGNGNWMAWNIVGEGNFRKGAELSGKVAGINDGGSVKGKLVGAGNLRNLTRTVEQVSAESIAEQSRPFEILSERLQVPNDVNLGKEVGIMEGGRIQNLVLTKQEAQKIFGHNAPAGLYSISVGRDGKIYQTVAKNGFDAFVVDSNGREHYDATNNGQVVFRERRSGVDIERLSKNLTIIDRGRRVNIGDKRTIYGDIGELMKRNNFKGVSKEIVNALRGVNGEATFHGEQFTIKGVLNPEQELILAEALGAYGDKFKYATETLIKEAEMGNSSSIELTGVNDSFSNIQVKHDDVGFHNTFTHTDIGNSENVADDYDTVLISGGYGDLYRYNKELFLKSPSFQAAVATIAGKLEKYFQAHATANQGTEIASAVNSSGSEGKSYYQNQSQITTKSSYSDGSLGAGLGSGERVRNFGPMLNASANLSSGWKEESMTRSEVGSKAKSGSETGYSNTTTSKFSSGVQLSSDILTREFIRDADKILARNDLSLDQKIADITKLEENYKAMFTNAIGDHRTLDKFNFDAHHAEQEEKFDAVRTYGNNYKNPYWNKVAQDEKLYDTFINAAAGSDNPLRNTSISLVDLAKRNNPTPNSHNPQPTQNIGSNFNLGDFKTNTPERNRNDIGEILNRVRTMNGESSLSQNNTMPHSEKEPEPPSRNDEDMTPSQSR